MLDLDDALDRLAPEVDLAASRDLFERRRTAAVVPTPPRRGRRPLALLVAAIVVLVVGIATAVTVGRPDDAQLDVRGPGQFGSDGTTPGTTGPPPTTVPVSGLLGAVDLPAVGTTGSGLLDDGMPVFVTHHPDGSVSVLPGMVDDGYVNPGPLERGYASPDQLTGTLEVVVAFGNNGFASNTLEWDPWGRAIQGGREHDLTGYAGVVVDDRVQVVASAVAPIPGEPQDAALDDPTSGDYPTVPDPLPSTPDQVSAIATAPPGWHRITDRVHLYGSGDVFRICTGPPGFETYSLDALATCSGPVVHGVTGPAGFPLTANGDPFLVRVDESGEVVGVAMYRLGGGTGPTPTPP
jgi:hypothetical protein